MNALEEYVEWESGPIREGTETPEDDLALGIKLARAAIAELEDRLKAAEAMSADAWRQVRIARDRAEQAEAHADAADAEHQRREDVLHEKLRQAEAENERLRAQIQERDEFLADSWGDP